ncbi:hypothetical protein M407DRAFT_3504 [Tulasnella calospora MUT 4182]|uniref:non-specific serine/threonine protein kinase n=1 Tax=Tulasnella calospora MUT 4182 TaxID=1051891 RepID=A0A0C3ML17_9AGAM|nr:hypothetical protein M407DRAFT_3504 [Tulasnella calospora MUT 4182]
MSISSARLAEFVLHVALHCQGVQHNMDLFSFESVEKTANALARWNGPIAREGWRFGYLPILPDKKLCNGRFQVVRKLGWGANSTVWLASATGPPQYVAIKVITAHATALHRSGILAEVSFLKRIESANPNHPGHRHCSRFYEAFFETAAEGQHLGFVMEPLGTDLAVYRELPPGTRLPIPAVKRLTKQTLLALDYLHTECGIIHCDLKPGNVLVSFDDVKGAIIVDLAEEPTALYPPRYDQSISDQAIITVKSQTLRSRDLKDDGSNIVVKLADFGHANWVSSHLTEDILPELLRPPEVIIGSGWDTAADIWPLGCLTFEYRTGVNLFIEEKEPTSLSLIPCWLNFCKSAKTKNTSANDSTSISSKRFISLVAVGRALTAATRY